MAPTKYPKPYVPTPKLGPEFDSYSYGTVWGYCAARLRKDQTWRVLSPTGERVAKASTFRKALDYALKQR